MWGEQAEPRSTVGTCSARDWRQRLHMLLPGSMMARCDEQVSLAWQPGKMAQAAWEGSRGRTASHNGSPTVGLLGPFAQATRLAEQQVMPSPGTAVVFSSELVGTRHSEDWRGCGREGPWQ